MSARLTDDEEMALALGWHHEFWTNKKYRNWYTPASTPERWAAPSLPKWTTSLDAITAEIEARGLDWLVQTDDSGEGHGYFAEIVNAQTTASADTPAKALCAALRDYLKKS